MAVSKIRQNYHEDCEALINKQINMEFYASYVYLSMVGIFFSNSTWQVICRYIVCMYYMHVILLFATKSQNKIISDEYSTGH